MGRMIDNMVTFLQRVTDRNRVLKAMPNKFRLQNGVLITESADGKVRTLSANSYAQGGVTNYMLEKTEAVTASGEEEWAFAISHENRARNNGGPLKSEVRGTWHEMKKLFESAKAQAGSVATVGANSTGAGWGRFMKIMIGSLVAIFVLLTIVPVAIQSILNPSMTSRVASTADLTPSLGGSPDMSQLTDPAQAGAALAGQKPASQESRVTPSEMKSLETMKGKIVFGDESGKPFYVFSDPNCPHCKKFDRTLQNVPKGFKAVVLPVAFISGSKELAAASICAKEPLTAWRIATESGRATNPSCTEGIRLVEENSAMLSGMRLTSTPSIVSPNGLIYAGSMTSEQLAVMVQN